MKYDKLPVCGINASCVTIMISGKTTTSHLLIATDDKALRKEVAKFILKNLKSNKEIIWNHNTNDEVRMENKTHYSDFHKETSKYKISSTITKTFAGGFKTINHNVVKKQNPYYEGNLPCGHCSEPAIYKNTDLDGVKVTLCQKCNKELKWIKTLTKKAGY